MLDLYKRAAGWRLYLFLPPSGYQVGSTAWLPQTLIAPRLRVRVTPRKQGLSGIA
jgi:hypothetical protein